MIQRRLNVFQGALKMVRPIMRDPLFLAGKSEPATEAYKQVLQDLLDHVDGVVI